MLKLLLIPVVAYLALLALIFFAQTAILFPARLALPSGPPPASAEPLELTTPSGERLHGVHLLPATPGDARLLLLGFGGNAWDAGAAALYLHELFPEADIVAFHYRGYGPSGGTPGAAALQADALLVHDLAVTRLAPDRTVAVGFSIGGGVAAYLGGRRDLDGLILVTPFDSLAEVAARHYPWLPVRLLFRHEMAPARELAGREVPVALIAAGGDTLIPPARSAALVQAVPNLVLLETIAGADHNGIYRHPDFRRAMRDAMAQLGH
jgi:uncharacterized protein